MNKYKKGAFIISLILLLIAIPLTVVGIIYHKKNSDIDNPNKEFHYNNKLYFYNNSGDLIGKYECIYKNCDYAKQMINDSEYGINHFNDYAHYENTLINEQYAFIADYKDNQNAVNLYDVKNNEISATYKSYKNYGIGIVNNYYIVESLTGTYGVIKIDQDGINNILPFTYEYIALQDDLDLEQNKISADSFIVKKDNKWYLIDENEAEFTSKIDNPIIAFDTSTFITKEQFYNIYNYDGTTKLSNNCNYLNYISKYLEVKDLNNNYYILDNTLSLKSKLYPTNEDTVIETKINDEGKIEIIIDNEIKETIDIL